MRIAIAGTGPLGAALMGALVDSDHEIVALLRNGRAANLLQRVFLPRLASMFTPNSSPLGMAKRRRIPIIYIDKMTETELSALRMLRPDVVLVGGFSVIFRKPLLELPRVGCVNCHSSLLPRHRGPNPFTAALLDNDGETGVTFHVMTEGIDSGDILAQYSLPIKHEDTAGSLYRRCSALAGENVLDVMDDIEENGLGGTPQDESQATYDKRLKRTETYIDWNKSAEEIHRFARACSPFTPARFRHGKRTVYISRCDYDPSHVDVTPGTVIEMGRRPLIAAGQGALRVTLAYTAKPIVWVWPSAWSKLKPGDRMT